MERLGLMTDAGKAVLPDMSQSGFVVDKDIMQALQSDSEVWENFQKFPPLYQRVRIDTIQIKKNQPRVFNARLAKFIKKHKKVYNVRRMERQRQVVLCRCFLIYFIISDCIVGFC